MKNLKTFSAAILLSQAVATQARGESVDLGFQTEPAVSHYWGNWSPWYSVASRIEDKIPNSCRINFAQVVARHGARDPAAKRSQAYRELVERIKKDHEGRRFTGKYAFLNEYNYTLGADELTEFGRMQMRNAGIKFHKRYVELAASSTIKPYVRSSGQKRVVDSCVDFMDGYKFSKGNKEEIPILVIPEGPKENNTLNNWRCDAFQVPPISRVGPDARDKFTKTFIPAIAARVSKDLGLEGDNVLKDRETLNLMDLCPFNTVAMSNVHDPKASKLHPFCDLFSELEWKDYDYLQTVDKYYGYAQGNPFGPTLSVGFVNELIARLTKTPVNDHTSHNHEVPFPTESNIYVDITHDTDLIGMYAAMGIYNDINVDVSKRQEPEKLKGYSLSWLVPFSARMYVEKMECAEGTGHNKEEWVRVIINDRVVELENCGGDPANLGRCRLNKWVESLAFARSGGKWNECFTKA